MGRWWVVFDSTPLMQLGPEVATPREALKSTKKLYPRYRVGLER